MTSGEHTKGHTPLPWKVCQTVIHGEAYGDHWIEPVDEDQDICISGSGGARSFTRRVVDMQRHDDNAANAELIVAAVNSHYDLITALRLARARLEYYGNISDRCHSEHDEKEILPQIDYALTSFREAQAGGGE